MEESNEPPQTTTTCNSYLIDEKINNDTYYVPSIRLSQPMNQLMRNPTMESQQYYLYGNWSLNLPGHSGREIITNFNSVINQNPNYFTGPSSSDSNITYHIYDKYIVSFTITRLSTTDHITQPYLYIYYNGNSKAHSTLKYNLTWSNGMDVGSEVHFKVQNNDSRSLTFYGTFITYNK